MRSALKTSAILGTTLLGLFISACNPDKEDQLTPQEETSSLQIPSDFSFSTTQLTKFRIQALNNQNRAMSGVRFDVYALPDDVLLFSGITNTNGVLETTHTIGGHIKQVDIRTNLPGLPNSRLVPYSGADIDVTLGGAPSKNGGRISSEYSSARIASGTPSVATFGGWDNNGFPNYLEPDVETISSQFLKDIQESLPESKPLPNSRPEYLKDSNPTTINLKETADVWVTFVHEGAGWQNALGFYTFDLANPPKSVSDIKDMKLIFPNVSYSGSGGSLSSGQKVKLGRFNKDKGIGFFLFADGFRSGTVSKGNYILYSHDDFNPETNTAGKPSIKRHFIILDDTQSNRYLLAAEDVRRDGSSDNDFNDAVFFVTTNPVTAVDDVNIPDMKLFKDTDNDGVSDTDDEYPTDPKRAFNDYTPAKGVYGTLAFEDMWPSKGDYDFNDLVLNYNVQQVLNASNQVVDIIPTYKVRAMGASFRNGVGFELPIPASNIKKVTGSQITQSYTSLAASGVETGSTTRSQIIIFDNAADKISRPAGAQSIFLNTKADEPKASSSEFSLKIELNSPVSQNTLGAPPYNIYMIARSERGREIHQPDFKPTARANTKLFNTADDRSKPTNDLYYRDVNNMPWVLNFPIQFVYPQETNAINNCYTKFIDWAKSKGTTNKDWYQALPGYCIEHKLIPANLR